MSVQALGSRRATLAGIGLALVAALGAACSGGTPTGNTAGSGPVAGDGGNGGTVAPAPTEKAAAPAAAIAVSPKAGARDLSPSTPVSVRATSGTLDAVRVVNAEGKPVRGTLSGDKHMWQAAEPLGYGKTYTVTASASNADGRQTSHRSSFTTVTPGNFTMPSFGPLVNGGTFGVGMIGIVHFDEPIPNRAAAEKALQVTTTPHVNGAWYWVDDQNVHYRPAHYWAPGTKITITAKVYGVNLGGGLYGQADQTLSYTIGRSQIAIIQNAAHTMYVYIDGKRVKTIPVSMGRGGSITVKGRTIDFWTRSGPHVVMEKYAVKTMSSESYGLPITDPLGYKEDIPLATRISGEGEFVHAASWSVGDQGVRNVSHGCVNISPSNADWFYHTFRYGDIVDIKGTPIQLSLTDGFGDWNMSWKDWGKGSALH